MSLILGVDASNIRQGGGVTHLIRLLHAADPSASEIHKVIVWSNKSTAKLLPDYPWLVKITPFWLEQDLLFRIFYQQFRLIVEMKDAGCNILFSPGGTLPWHCSIPTVTMSQNMLPFEQKEAAKFGYFSLMYFKLRLLRIAQKAFF